MTHPLIYVTGCGPSASAHMLQDSGELCSLTERDSSFPHSTPGVVPLVPTCIHKINKLKPTCIWTGWRLRETQKTILNTQCINHSCQGEGDPKRRVQWCSLPKPRVDVTPRSKSDLRPLSCCVSGKRIPRQ